MTRGVLGALFLCACSTAPVANEPPQSRQVPSPDERRADIEACIHGLYHPLDTGLFVAACADLWLQPACRKSWSDSLATPPGGRGEYVIRQCAAAYCPELSPAPPLCAHDLASVDLLATSPDWIALWADFNATALSRDLGLAEGDTRGSVIARRLLQSVATSGSELTDD